MSPQTVKYVLDVATLLLGVYVVIQLVRSSIGGAVGSAFKLILVGVFVLAINHFLDTAYFANALKEAGHTADLFQAPIVHRVINFFGFLTMAIGFRKLTAIPR